MKMLKYSIYKLKQVSKSGAHFLIQEHLAPNIQAYFASGHNGNWYGKYTVMQKIYMLKFCYKE